MAQVASTTILLRNVCLVHCKTLKDGANALIQNCGIAHDLICKNDPGARSALDQIVRDCEALRRRAIALRQDSAR